MVFSACAMVLMDAGCDEGGEGDEMVWRSPLVVEETEKRGSDGDAMIDKPAALDTFWSSKRV
jgi:hypothetical protein